MRMIFGVVLLLGVALAGGAVYLAKSHIGDYQQALAKERAARKNMIKTVAVYVAKNPLKYGAKLTAEDVKQVQWPENAIPEGAFRTSEALFPKGEDVERVVLRAIEPDEAILAAKVTAPGENAGLTSRLEPGMRAFALRVDVASGVSGFLRPGDRVDIYWTGNFGGKRGDVTKLIEAGVPLIAVDQTAATENSGTIIARTVTVKASPQQVAALAQAQSTGRLSLSLVGSEDEQITEAIEVDQKSLLGIRTPQNREIEAPRVVTKVVEKKNCTIRTRRGLQVVETTVRCSG